MKILTLFQHYNASILLYIYANIYKAMLNNIETIATENYIIVFLMSEEKKTVPLNHL